MDYFDVADKLSQLRQTIVGELYFNRHSLIKELKRLPFNMENFDQDAKRRHLGSDARSFFFGLVFVICLLFPQCLERIQEGSSK